MNRVPGPPPAQSLRYEARASKTRHESSSAASHVSGFVAQSEDWPQDSANITSSDDRLRWEEEHNDTRPSHLPHPAAPSFVSPSVTERDSVSDDQDGNNRLKLYPASREATAGILSEDASSSRTASHTSRVQGTTSFPRSSPRSLKNSQEAQDIAPAHDYRSDLVTLRSTKQTPVQPIRAHSKSGAGTATGGIRRIHTTGHTQSQKFHISVPSQGMPQIPGLEQENRMHYTGTLSKEAASAIVDDDIANDPPNARSGAIRQVMQGNKRPERSVSRGRTQMEKSIEATVKKPETSGYVRSRKASHMMGIFDSRSEPVRRVDRSQDIDTRSEFPSANEYPKTPLSVTTKRESNDEYFANRIFDTESVSELVPQSEEPQEISPATTDRTNQLFVDNEQTPRASLPDVLLQEIRQPSQGQPEPLRNKASTPGLSVRNDHVLEVGANEPPSQHDDEEEHISAAVYYPHEGPSSKEVDEFNHDEIGVPTNRMGTAPTSLQPPSAESAQHLGETAVDPQDEHIDIFVESNYEKSVFHGTLKAASISEMQEAEEEGEGEEAKTPRMPPIDQRSSAQPQLSSESDFESSDEVADLSQPDEGTATPTARQELLSKEQTRTGAGSVTKSRTAVTLAPYKHQVGGHSTIFRFSRRAVCKQLNNRENEFYERVEQSHPDMLKFLPRYIGVLNVTFSKGPKQAQDEANAGQNSQAEVQKSRDVGGSALDKAQNTMNGDTDSEVKSKGQSQPRIVSHSQQTDSVAQVLLDQNRHLLQSEYFGLPQRPKSADPTHFRQRCIDRAGSKSTPSPLNDKTNNGTMSPRPSMPGHTGSLPWGISSINDQLKAKILREVFGGVPQINMVHRHHRHSHTHAPTTNSNSYPIRKEPEDRRRANLSMTTFSDIKEVDDQSGRHSIYHSAEQATQSYPPQTSREKSLLELAPSGLPKYSSSAKDYDHDLSRIHTTDSVSTEPVSETNRLGPRRRHSGMGLRRRRKSLSGAEQADLEYFEDEALSVMREDEVFAMDEDSHTAQSLLQQQSSNTDDPYTALSDNTTDAGRTKISSRDASVDSEGSVADDLLAEDRLPINPKEAQSANPDQRVAYFLLLEDLTAGMGQPCVLDLKMGTRQYGVEANEKKIMSQRKKCAATTSQQLGVRICGMQAYNRKTKESEYKDKYFGREIQAGKQFRKALTRFLFNGISYDSVSKHIPIILHKLSKLETMVRRLPGYRLYASSLLMYYDAEPEKSREYTEAVKNGVDLPKQRKLENKPWPPPVEIKLVDFANCVTSEDALPEGAQAPPHHPGAIDRGYLRGLHTLKYYFERILKDIESGQYEYDSQPVKTLSAAFKADEDVKKAEVEVWERNHPREEMSPKELPLSDTESESDYAPARHENEDDGDVSI